MSAIDLYKLSVMKNRLELAITDEVRKRIPDTMRLSRLKKLRLAIKDQIAGQSGRPVFA